MGGSGRSPGLMKTPAIEQALNPLKRLEIAAKTLFEQEVKGYQTASALADAEQGAAKTRLKKIVSNAEATQDDKQAAALAVAQAQPELPPRQRYLVNDATVEKLGELLNQNPNGVLVYRDELTGWLRSLDKDGQEGARGFYLEAWNGNGRYTFDRIGRGTIDIEAAKVSIIGGIQPGPLADYIRALPRAGRGTTG